jgi:hypothetical protein
MVATELRLPSGDRIAYTLIIRTRRKKHPSRWPAERLPESYDSKH